MAAIFGQFPANFRFSGALALITFSIDIFVALNTLAWLYLLL